MGSDFCWLDFSFAKTTIQPAAALFETLKRNDRIRQLSIRKVFVIRTILALALAAGLRAAAGASELPASLAPPAPFPTIGAQTFEAAFVAPGVRFCRYYLLTADGPLVISALAVDPREPTIRIAPVLAADRLISSGETLSSMVRRTSAVAGINGDYFDIGNTYQPIGLVVRDGSLLRSPTERAAAIVTATHEIRFASHHFHGYVALGDRRWLLGGIDIWPPQGEATLILPVLGPIPPLPGGRIAIVARAGGNRYRVVAIDDLTERHSPALGLVFRQLAAATPPTPLVGDVIAIDYDTEPALDDAVAAIGGGPLLVRDGALYRDPNPPAANEALRRVPLSGLLRRADGSLVLLEVDGHAPERSTGLLRAEFAALLRSFDATDGMLLDGGGSASLAVRALGDREATLATLPSDGVERPIADALLVYSDAPAGPPARLAVRPGAIVAVRGAPFGLHLSATDAAGHPVPNPVPFEPRYRADPATLLHGGVLVAGVAGAGTLHVQAGELTAHVPLRIVERVARLEIVASNPNPDPGERITLSALGTDRAGAPVILGSISWSQHVASGGVLVAGAADATVTASAGGMVGSTIVRVGRRTIPLPIFTAAEARHWAFGSVPRDGPGEVSVADGGLALSYDFGGDERAAYANARIRLAGVPRDFSLDVEGDGGGAGLRAALIDAHGERIAVTLAKRIDWHGRRRVIAHLGNKLREGMTLASLYVVNSLGGPPSKASGTIVLRDLHVTFAGSSLQSPAYSFPTETR